jgi:HEPN domain-containing protein
LANERIADAEALLQAGRFGGAYYFSGLAVECALKARIASKTNASDFPDLKRARDSQIETRYDPNVTQSKAEELFSSAAENNNGVLSWLRTVW